MRWHSPGLLAPVLVAIAVALEVPPSVSAERSAAIAAPRSASSRAAAPTASRKAKRSATQRKAVASRTTTPSPKPVAGAGMVIGVDRETGSLVMPTPEQIAKLRESESRTTPPPPVFLPNGIKRLDARGWSREHFVVRRGPDGKLVPVCVDGRAEAARALRQPPVPVQEEE